MAMTQVLLSCLLALATSSSLECAWVLWVEAPGGSDQWSVANVRQPRFTANEDCQRMAGELNALELSIGEVLGMSGEARDAFSCLPCTVDPRPEGALLHEGPSPPGSRK